MFRNIFGLSIAVSLVGVCQPVFANEGDADSFPPAQNLNHFDAPGADQLVEGVASPMGSTSRYLFVAGSAFTPRTSSQTVTYPGAGCTYSDQGLTTSLELPTGALIQGVRLYYYSLSSTANLSLFLTNYPGDGTFTDLISGTTASSAGGYLNDYFSPASAIAVDNVSGSYVLSATMQANTRFCGMRVFYSF